MNKKGEPAPPREDLRFQSPSEEQIVELRFRAKKELRTRFSSVLRALPKEARAERSTHVCERLGALDEFKRAQTVLLFWPMRTEPDLAPLFAQARSLGKTVALPAVTEQGDTYLAQYEGEKRLARSVLGFMQPDPECLRIGEDQIELTIVPGLCFDERGFRVGRGKGYYDTLLPELTRSLHVGVAFDFQIVVEVPNTQNDVPVRVLITDQRTIRV